MERAAHPGGASRRMHIGSDRADVMVLPGLGKSFDQFNADDAVCRQWGLQATGRSLAEAAAESGVTSAAGGTVVGDAGGAASGATAATPPMGSAAAGAGGTKYSGQEAQWRYDMAYQQCMYSRGHQIPAVPAGYRGVSAPAPPPALTPKPLDSSAIPPPPPGRPHHHPPVSPASLCLTIVVAALSIASGGCASLADTPAQGLGAKPMRQRVIKA